jgi:hypothetical protein
VTEKIYWMALRIPSQVVVCRNWQELQTGPNTPLMFRPAHYDFQKEQARHLTLWVDSLSGIHYFVKVKQDLLCPNSTL